MSTPLAPGQVFCEECGAQNDAKADRCWLCYSKLPDSSKPEASARAENAAVDAEVFEITGKPPVIEPPVSGTVVALQMVAGFIGILLILVGIGAFAHDATMGIVYCAVVTPAVIIGLVSFLMAKPKPVPVAASSGGKFVPGPQPESARPLAVGLSSFLMSLAATVGAVLVAAAVAVLIIAAMIIALIAQCFAALGGGR